MALFDLSDPAVPLPAQLVVDTSLLLALRPTDDNPHAAAARAFVQRLSERIAAYELVSWLPLPVLQECSHVILANGLRRIWETMDPATRPPNWLKAYKDQPALLQDCLPDLTRFRDLLIAIPLTPVRPEDLTTAPGAEVLEDRMQHFIAAHHLLPQDALILAETERLGVRAVATLDQDWWRVTGFDVYTCPSYGHTSTARSVDRGERG
jgi:predicted nucleic acid-binding protein